MLGSFVREERNKLGLSVHEAAERWGLTESALYMIERGERTKLQPDTLVKLARGLGLTIEDLLGKTTPQEIAS